MKNFIKSNVFGFMLGVILCGGIVYGVNTYQSNSIEYSPTDSSWNVNNVNEAINSLYSIKTNLDATKTELNSTKTSLDNLKSIGDATAAQILSGKTALVQGSTITGTMTDRGAVTNSLNAGGSYTIPAGYHNGSGKVTANSLASQTSATATAAQILTGQTAYVNGSRLTGTMTNRGAWTNTPTGSGKVTIPAGYHNGSGYVDTSTVYNNAYNSGANNFKLVFVSSSRDTNSVTLSTAYQKYLVVNSNATEDTTTNNNAITIASYSGCTIQTLYTKTDTTESVAESLLLVTRTGSGNASITFSGFAGKGWRNIIGISK